MKTRVQFKFMNFSESVNLLLTHELHLKLVRWSDFAFNLEEGVQNLQTLKNGWMKWCIMRCFITI